MSKRRKIVDGKYVINKNKTEVDVHKLEPDNFHILRVTSKDMEEFNSVMNEKIKWFKENNKQRKKKKDNPIDCFFIHLSPNVTFLIKMEK